MSSTRLLAISSAAFLAAVCGAPVSLAAQTPKPAPPARVTIQLDSASVARFDVRAFDLGVTQNSATRNPMPASTAEIQLVKQAGPYTGDLVRLSASGVHAPFGTIEILDSLGVSSMTIRLSDVSVVSDHLASSGARAGLEQQRISLQETLTQLTTDYQEAQRELATAEELGKSKVMTRQDLARAREHAAELQQRINLARQRQALLSNQLDTQGGLEESVVLHFGRIEIDAPGAGGSMSWDFSGRNQSQDSTTHRPPRPNGTGAERRARAPDYACAPRANAGVSPPGCSTTVSTKP